MNLGPEIGTTAPSSKPSGITATPRAPAQQLPLTPPMSPDQKLAAPTAALSSSTATASDPPLTSGHPTTAGPPVTAPVASEAVHPVDAIPDATASIDPHKPSDESAPTALPTNPATHPEEQAQAARETKPEVVGREVEKTKAAERELKGEKPKGTVVAGMEDDRLYAMMRRFDVQITHVLHPATKLPPSEPDLRPSTLPNLPSHSETLKSNLERVFAAVGPSSLRGAREVARMTSWSREERVRTGLYCAGYFLCWVFGYTLVGVFSFLVALVCFPGCRRYLFPPVAPPPFTPPSATDPTNQKGDESLIGNVDNKTVHRSKAEQAEEQAFEARSILQAYTQRLVFDGRKKGKNAGNSAVGEKQLESDDSSDDADANVEEIDHGETGEVDALEGGPQKKKPQGLVSADVVVGGEHISLDDKVSDKEKKKIAQQEAKKKRDELVSKMTKGTEDGLGAFADMMEMMQNALSPPSAYPDSNARFKLAGAFLIPPMLLLHFVPTWMFGRGTTFAIGVGLWGRPLLIRGAEEFVKRVPNWQDLLDLRNSILSGVPTDAQLTLHLMRVAEALGTPLPRPPPPPLKGTPKEAIKDTTPATITADDEAEVEAAEEQGGAEAAATKAKVKTKSHILGAFKSVGRKMAGFHGDVSVDGAAKRIGTKVDKVLFQSKTKDHGSRDEYPAKLDKTSGHIVIDGRTEIAVPQISFVPLSGKEPTFVYPIDDIVELKKSHVSMPRMALGWASGAEVEGLGMTVRFKTAEQQLAETKGAVEKIDGETMHFTRMSRREELFVRLISMGRQRWEVL